MRFILPNVYESTDPYDKDYSEGICEEYVFPSLNLGYYLEENDYHGKVTLYDNLYYTKEFEIKVADLIETNGVVLISPVCKMVEHDMDFGD